MRTFVSMVWLLLMVPAGANAQTLGVTALADRSDVYVNVGDHVEAVSVTTGKTKWSSRKLIVPLAMHGRTLIATGEKDGELTVVLANRRSGKILAQFPLGKDSHRLVDMHLGLGEHKVVSAEVHGDTAHFWWAYSRTPIRGAWAANPEEIVRFSGRLAIDLGSRKVVKRLPPEPQPQTPQPSDSSMDRCAAWRCKSELAPGGVVNLIRAREGGPSEQVQIGSKESGVTFDSEQHRYILVSQASDPYGPTLWHVYDVSTMKRVFAFKSKFSFGRFIVRKERFIGLGVSPADSVLVAHDAGGDLVWSRAVPSYAYDGQIPQ